MTELIEGNTFVTQGKRVQFISADGDWVVGIYPSTVVDTGYKEPNYIARTEGIVEERTFLGFLFTLTKQGNLYMHTTFHHPDNKKVVVQANLLAPYTEVPQDLKEGINQGLQMACFSKCDTILGMYNDSVHPSDVSPILAHIANLSDYDAWLLGQHNERQAYVDKQKAQEKPERNYVYFIRVPSGITKIGCTTNLENRIKGIQGMCSEPLTLLGTIETPEQYKVEESLHEYFTDKQVHGEWYDVSTSDIEQATKQLHYDYQVA